MNDSLNLLKERITRKIRKNSGKEIKVFEKSKIDTVKKNRHDHPLFGFLTIELDSLIKNVVEKNYENKMKEKNPGKPNIKKGAGKNQKVGTILLWNQPIDRVNEGEKNRKSNGVEQHCLSALPK